MAARGPPSSVSIPAYRQGGSGGTPDSLRRGRGGNRSSGSSGANSRDHSVEGRSERRGGLELRGSGDFRAAYHSQYRKQTKKDFERVSWGQPVAAYTPVESGFVNESKGRRGILKAEAGSEGRSNRGQQWRSDRGVHDGRAGGSFPDAGGPRENEYSRPQSLTIGSHRRGLDAFHHRQENGYDDPYRRQEVVEGANQRQEKSGHRVQDNSYSDRQRQEDGYSRNAGQEQVSGSYHGRRAYGRTSSGGSSRGRELGASNESVFGDAGELETFGSPRSLSRTIKAGTLPSAAQKPKLQQSRHDHIKDGRDDGGSSYVSPREGDLRRSLSNESKGREEKWSNKGSSLDDSQTQTKREILDGNQVHHNERSRVRKDQQVISGAAHVPDALGSNFGEKLKNRDGEITIPGTSSSKGGLSKSSSLNGRKELPLIRTNSSKSSLTRRNSLDRRTKREESGELPDSSLSSPAEVGVHRVGENSIPGSLQTSDLKEGETRSRMKELESKVWECASAGMHKTRSTDWYEICLQEEEEELEALAAQQHEESPAKGSMIPTITEERNFGRDINFRQQRVKSGMFGANSGAREANSLDYNWSHERMVRVDPAQTTQLNISTPTTNVDLGSRQGFFTPWNALQQSTPNVNFASLSAPRPKSLLHQFERTSGVSNDAAMKLETLKVSVVGGQQSGSRARRTITTVPVEETDNWRTGRRSSRQLEDRQGQRAEKSLLKSVEGALGGAVLVKTNKNFASLGSPASTRSIEETENLRGGRRYSKTVSEDGLRAEQSLEKHGESQFMGSVPSEARNDEGSTGAAIAAISKEEVQDWRAGRRFSISSSEDGLQAERSREKPGESPFVVAGTSEARKDESSVGSATAAIRSEGVQDWNAGRRFSKLVSEDSLRSEQSLEKPGESPLVIPVLSERRKDEGSARLAPAAIIKEEAQDWRAGRRQSINLRAEQPDENSVESTFPGLVSSLANDNKCSPVSSRKPAKIDQDVVTDAVLPPRRVSFYRAIQESMIGDEQPLPHIVGTCLEMCPERERLQREKLRDLAVFERVSGDMRKTSKELAVKKFCRTVMASELEPSDVRPLPVLWRTLQYLLGLLDDPEFPFDIVHNFLFDRTRAIRQELGMQRIFVHQTITIHEEIVRFHIVSENELRELNRKRSKQFDTHLNLQQLSKSLHSLLNLYITLGADGTSFENEAEFHAYYVLLNIGNHGRFQAEPLSLWFPTVPSHVLEGPPMKFARKALRLYRSNNFVGFFRLVRNATYLQCCLLELSFDSIRAMALAMLNVAEYKIHPFPLSDLAQQLILTEDDVEKLCLYHGLPTGVENTSQKLCLLAKQAPFSTPEKGISPQYSCPLIESKRASSFFLEVKGSVKTS